MERTGRANVWRSTTNKCQAGTSDKAGLHKSGSRKVVTREEQLVVLIAQGDRGAFVEFYDRHAPRVLGLLAGWLPTRTEANHLLQEVFWQVWKNADEYDASKMSPQQWLFSIARSQLRLIVAESTQQA